MGNCDARMRMVFEAIARAKHIDTAQVPSYLRDHEWDELNDRQTVLQPLHDYLMQDHYDAAVLKKMLLGSFLLKGMAIGIAINDYFKSKSSLDHLERLLADRANPPSRDKVDAFIRYLTKSSFRDKKGVPKRADAALFASVLLTALYPACFVDYRHWKWNWIAQHFDLDREQHDNYADAVFWAAHNGKMLTETQTFKNAFDSMDIEPMWIAAGLCALLSKNEELKEIVERVNESQNPPPKEKRPVNPESEPKNLILYGPPGTGKTYELQHTYFPQFTDEKSKAKRYRFVTFHQSFCYEDFVEGIKPVVRTDDEDLGKGQGEIRYTIKPGVFRELAEDARKDPSNKYALFIDEINRGNVANIFGELITFIEGDKRLNDDGKLEGSPWTATLPYSRALFGVPRNLYIIGTMNTADRSIEALDTALRRRFSFVPTYPNPELLRQYQPDGFDVNLEKLLKAMNERLELLLDRDHTIGHSFLMGIKKASNPEAALAELQRVFANSILPLLQEYFYGNPSRIGMVLGSAFVSKRRMSAKLASGNWDSDDAEAKEVYDITSRDEWNLAAFQAIYA